MVLKMIINLFKTVKNVFVELEEVIVHTFDTHYVVVNIENEMV